ncbi:MAG: ferredoxin family protein [Candidatus Thermoplasmatota archaeon]|jgi:NAD-dependent dihydropyrimidine dehydrogenase PreA subunit|nr:ferredoxin family protein [Candidatus Thermoplasmatota archaeon]
MNNKTWHGLDRENFDWFPFINSELCTGCGMCLLTCGNNVFSWNDDRKKPLVVNPKNCVIGCTSCGKLCPENAIDFPGDPKSYVTDIIKNHKLFLGIRKEMDARLSKFPDHILNGSGNK